jgi:hypothetical protein
VGLLEARRANAYQAPISPATGKAASCTNPATWGSYRQARAAASRLRLDGIGFVFTTADPYTGVNLDHCRRDQADLEPWAVALVERLDSYTEWSPCEGLYDLLRVQAPVGCSVTLKCNTLRRSCSSTINTNSTLMVIVGTVKKSEDGLTQNNVRTDVSLLVRWPVIFGHSGTIGARCTKDPF